MGKIIIEVIETEDGNQEMIADIKMKKGEFIQSTRALVKECEKLTGSSWLVIDAIEEMTTTVVNIERKES